MLKIEKVGYRYPNLVFSLNGQTTIIRVKDKRGKKWIKLGNIESVHVYPTIENDISRDLKVPVRDMGRLMKEVLNNFPTRMANTNEPALKLIWEWRHEMFENKSGMLGS